ncbi:MAG: class IV adenylate cyclase [Haloarculaceae archaeon]
MYEVEVKVRTPHAPVRERLAALDAASVGRVEQVDTYYDAPHRDFAETDEALRLRRETDLDADATTTRITYKGPLVDAQSKTRHEAETAVEDGAAIAAVLDGLGFQPAATVEKERDRYRLDGYTVTLDAVADLGEFVEVEREAADEDVDEAREGAFAVLRSLGLDPAAQIRTSYLGLLLDNRQ